MIADQHRHAVILFDGVCNLCNSAVQTVIKNDPAKYFRFASLQSAAGMALLKQYNVASSVDFESIVLIENNQVFQYATAALKIARHLKGGWQFLYPFIMVPAFIRNAVYKFIARNRYKWWGKQESCLLPGPDMEDCFL